MTVNRGNTGTAHQGSNFTAEVLPTLTLSFLQMSSQYANANERVTRDTHPWFRIQVERAVGEQRTAILHAHARSLRSTKS